jgi:hypothetical protein
VTEQDTAAAKRAAATTRRTSRVDHREPSSSDEKHVNAVRKAGLSRAKPHRIAD